MLHNIKAIFFDLDNTLIDRNAAFDACMQFFFELNLSDFQYENERKKILKKDNWGYTTRVDFCRWFILEYQPYNYDEQSFWQYQKKNISNFVLPISLELKTLLLNLKEKYTLGILTNGSIYNQTKKLEKSGILPFFDKENIFISQQYKLAKPNPKIFELVLASLNVKANELLYIGDDPINDIKGAKFIGIQTCWLCYGRKLNNGILSDFEVDNVNDLIK